MIKSIGFALAAFCLVQSRFAFGQTPEAKTSYKIIVAPPVNGKVFVEPPIPSDAQVAAGTVLSVTLKPSDGYALDSGFWTGKGPWWPAYYETNRSQFEVVADQDRFIGGSFIDIHALEGFKVTQDIVYAQPGVKKLKYDVYSPYGATNLPCIIIIHGGAWIFNTEDIMRGLARELVRGGKYVVFSIDYRWLGTADGDATPNTMADIIGDVYGAIAHIQEHAREYGGDPARIAVTGDSAGGHLSAAAIDMVGQIGDGGFGVKEGVFQFKPTYMPAGKTIEQVRREITDAIKVAAPSYGVFSEAELSKIGHISGPAVEAVSPEMRVPNISERAAPQFLLRGSRDMLISDREVRGYADALKAAGQHVEYVQVEGAAHAFFDWKPDPETKATFARYGVPYAAKMEAFFDTVFYPK